MLGDLVTVDKKRAELARAMERFFGGNYKASKRDIDGLPESQLDYLLGYYSNGRPHYVW